MRKCPAHVVLVSLTAACFGLPPSCTLPTLIVDDYVIEGSAIKGGQPLRSTLVSLYSQGKLIRRLSTDAQGRFTLDRLKWGMYRLSIQELGTFDIKVVVTAVEELRQRRYHSFYQMEDGCLGWGFSAN